MSLLTRFSAIIANIEIADLIHDTGIMKQFIIKGLHGLAYILDITQNLVASLSDSKDPSAVLFAQILTEYKTLAGA